MKSRELINLGFPHGEILKLAIQACAQAADAGLSRSVVRESISRLHKAPGDYLEDPHFGVLAKALTSAPSSSFIERDVPAPHQIWGEGLESESIAQMQRACRLPVSARGALMPDAHVGYGLPIGGVLATTNAIIPYAVGVDIACRMRLSVVDLDPDLLDSKQGRDRLTKAIESQTIFGIGGRFPKPRQHDVMDQDWSICPITRQNKDRAWSQLGTSGSGNHFVEFGVLTVPESNAALAYAPKAGAGNGSGWHFDLKAGRYLALLSHSGSRGTGAAVCDHYSRIAMQRHPQLPKDLKYLAWLDMSSAEGQAYFAAMNLMGQYASANHECIHRHVVRDLGAEVLAHVENHHNFAWKELHDLDDGLGQRELIVHRKGATPAGKGVLGVIPGSMATPGFVVCGRGKPASLRSASHGAGRMMSRTKAKDTFAWGNVRRDLERSNVHVISAGLDEVPGAYKNIHTVMSQQADLVNVVAQFDPRLVKMAPDGERAED